MRKLENAIGFALRAHAGTSRKGKDRPYIMHPLEVLTIVGSLTEDEDVLSAAVLHDTLEDTETKPEEIKNEFGTRVLALVEAESEDKMRDVRAEDSWKTRKEATIKHLKTAERDIKLICLGDKLANLREIARDYALIGDDFWLRFNQTDRKMHKWYYNTICGVLEEEFGQIPAILEYKELLTNVFGV